MTARVRSTLLTLLHLAGWTVYFGWFWSHAVFENVGGGWSAAHLNVWGDWAIHFTMGSAMAFRDLFLDQSPLLIGAPFKYPFFVNWVSAVLIRAGVPFIPAFTGPSFLFCVSSVVALYFFYRAVLGGAGRAIAASSIFLLNGGWGFLTFIKTVAKAWDPLHTLAFPPERYTRLKDLQWINVVDCMLIPQRSFQLGLAMALALLAVLYRWSGPRFTDAPPPRPLPRNPAVPIVLGLLLGVMPIVHVHSFAAVALFLAGWIGHDFVTRAQDRRDLIRWWGWFISAAAVAFVPNALFFVSGGDKAVALRWEPGWYGTGGIGPWLAFWWRNWGLTPAITAAGVVACAFVRGRRARTLAFFAPFAFLFAFANLWALHPWLWDNAKILVWASVGFSGFAAMALVFLWRQPRWTPLTRSAAIAVFAAMVLSGGIDVYRALIPSINELEMYTNEDLYAADWVRRSTPVDSVWLAGDYHNEWLFNLTGRQAVKTYTGWLWTHGYDYTPVETDYLTMYRHPERADLLRKYRVDYIVVGPNERDNFSLDERAFSSRFPVAFQTKGIRIYGVSDRARRSIGEALPRPDVFAPVLPLTAKPQPGLVKHTYHGRYFIGRSLVKTGAVDLNFRYDVGEVRPFPNNSCIEWIGFLRVDNDATYTFGLVSDDGAWLALDDVTVIDNSAATSLAEARTEVHLKPGFHRFRVRYFDVGGGAVLQVGWTNTPNHPPLIEPAELFH